MRTEESKTLYTSPAIEAIEIDRVQTICTSTDGNTEGYDINDNILDNDDFE